ncbi:MAG: esterase-like activity of phytase family protein [Rickettsiales bacterium]
MRYIYKVIALLLLGCSVNEVEFARFSSGLVSSIQKYKITATKEILNKTKGYPPAVGSGLFFLGKEGEDLLFYAVSDRGPNAPVREDGLNKVIFFSPDYFPVIATVKVTKNKAEIINHFSVIKLNGKSYTGMPTNGIVGPSYYRIPVDENVKDIHQYVKGMDSESIALDKEGNIWIGEEYEPAIIKLDKKTKRATKVYRPGEGLPDYIRHIQVNRGFEAIAFAPNGMLYAVLEGTLNFNNKAHESKFIRFFEINPKTDEIRVFAYKFDDNIYKSPKYVKIGDLVAINNDEFLLVEQGKTKEGSVRNVIQRVNIKNATNISNYISKGGGHLEHKEDLSHIEFIKKTPFLDVNKYGWDENKLEGLSIVDNQTIAISNDNDFGIDSVERNYNCESDSCDKLRVHKPDSKQHTKLWIIKFREKFF